MKRKLLTFGFLLSCFSAIFAQGKPPIAEIFRTVPADLGKENKLLVAIFEDRELSPMEQRALARDKQFAKQVEELKRMVAERNEELVKILKKYNTPYQLVKMHDIDSLKTAGYKYYLDMSVMPKQFKDPKKEAMFASYTRFDNANEMYANYNVQFHYYFYIRNIQNDDVYLTSEFKGYEQGFVSLEKFLDKVKKEMK